MRISTRLLSNAATNYLRMGATFALGLFTTWYVVGAAGLVGFGLISLAVSSSGPSRAVERTLQLGLVPNLSAALASGDPATIRRAIASAFRLCLQVVAPLTALVVILSIVAWAGVFNVPGGRGPLTVALAVLILAEGLHAVVRLLAAPLMQSLFASQLVATDNLLMVLARLTHALSAVVVFGWWLPDAPLPAQLVGFAALRATLQLADVAIGVQLARRRLPAVRLDRAIRDEPGYREMRRTVWSFAQVAVLINILPRFMAILINLFFGIAYNAVWEIAVQFAGYAWVASEGLLRGIAPLTAHLREGGRSRVALGLMARTIRYQLAVSLPATLLLGLYAGPLLDLWVGRRLAADTNLSAAGIAAERALDLAAAMAALLLVSHLVRSSFFGIERILYGMGEVRAYASFAKWAALAAVGAAAAGMALSGRPIAAPIGVLTGVTLYSVFGVVAAARRRVGLRFGAALRRSVPRPLAANLLFAACLLLARPLFSEPSLPGAVALLLGSAAVYGALALLFTPEPDERPRLWEIVRRLGLWPARRLRPRTDGPPPDREDGG